jgi:di-N-acetylchitobiase
MSFPRNIRASLLLAAALVVVAYADGSPKRTFAFITHDDHGYKYYNWSRITDIGFWNTPHDDILKLANQHNVKLWQDSHLPDSKTWTDDSKVDDWVKQKVQQVQSGKLTGGVFFDYEGQEWSADIKKAYTNLAKKTSDALKQLNASVFVCVGGRPSYEFRDFDYKGLGEHSEFLFIMGYDMHFWDDYTCVTKGTCSPANAGIKDLTDGVNAYLKDVPADKLVLGLPWYGIRYEVIVVPWNRGQVQYADILTAMNDKQRFKSLTYDDPSQTWVLKCNGDCIHDKTGGTIWFDDAKSLTPKYKLAKDNGLLGVGCWEISYLPLPDGQGNDPNQKERNDMLNTFMNWYN